MHVLFAIVHGIFGVSDGLRKPFEKGFLKNPSKTFYWVKYPMIKLSGICPLETLRKNSRKTLFAKELLKSSDTSIFRERLFLFDVQYLISMLKGCMSTGSDDLMTFDLGLKSGNGKMDHESTRKGNEWARRKTNGARSRNSKRF
jgi:hypothetical protein